MPPLPDDPPPTQPAPQGRRWDPRKLVLLSQFSGIIVALTLAGLGLDVWLGTTPWLLIAGGVLGVILAMVSLVATVNSWNRR